MLKVLSEGDLPSTRDLLTQQVSGWLKTALRTLGAGAKTAAGYGYFQSADSPPRQKSVKSQKPEPK